MFTLPGGLGLHHKPSTGAAETDRVFIVAGRIYREKGTVERLVIVNGRILRVKV